MGYPINAERVCIDQYRGNDVSGRIYSKCIRKEFEFNSMAGLLLRTEDILDIRGKPQAFQRKRTFQPSARGPTRSGRLIMGQREEENEFTDEEITRRKGELATYDVVIESRLHTTCQGFVRDPEGNFLGEFESELKLLELLLDRMVQNECQEDPTSVKTE